MCSDLLNQPKSKSEQTEAIMENPLNIYMGPESLKKYYDPDHQPLLPLVEIPEKLNPFLQDNVRIYAKMMTCLPAHNIKALPCKL